MRSQLAPAAGGDARAPWSSTRRRAAALALLCAVLFFVELGSRALWDVDEGMHAAMSKHVLVSGDWVTPTLNGQPFLDKPMLFTWLGALSMAVLGLNEFAARLPGALLALATVFVTYRLGRRMFDETTAWVAGAVLASSLMFVVLARSVVHDMALACSVTWALYLFQGLEAESDRRRGRRIVLLWIAVALGILAKGLLGAVLPGLVICAYLVLRGRIGSALALRPAAGIAIVAAIIAPWYTWMEARNPGYLRYFLVDQHLKNFASSTPTHPEPFYHYVPLLVLGLFPWGLVLLPGAAAAVRRCLRDRNDAGLLLVLWAGGIFLFFSAASSKLPSYLLPMFPAAALLIALPWADALRGARRSSRALAWWLLPTAVLCVAAFVWAVVSRPGVVLAQKYGVAEWKSTGLVGLVALTTAAAALLAFARRFEAAFWALACTMAVTVPLFTALVAPDVDLYRSSKGLAAPIEALVPAGEPLCFYRGINDSLLFYTDHPAIELRNPRELIDHVSSRAGAWCVITQEHFPLLQPVSGRLSVLARSGDKFLVRFDPPADAGVSP